MVETRRILPDGSVLACHEAPDVAPCLAVVSPEGAIRELFAATPAAVRAAPYLGPTHVTYLSADGTEIGAGSTAPRAPARRRPVPGRGRTPRRPDHHSGATWEPVAQYFVDKGYAWLQPNYRGSTSYGRELRAPADHGAGVADTAEPPLAAHSPPPRRPRLGRRAADRDFGASYGSYMALCATVDTPSTASPAAWPSTATATSSPAGAQGDREGRLDLERMMGVPADAREAYRVGLPIHRIEQLAVPLLIAHGEQDERGTWPSRSTVVDALRRLGKAFEYVTYPTEAHGLLCAGSFLHFHRRLERFLDWHLMQS